MNPDTTIRPWIRACGKQFGVRVGEDYRWPDADSRQEEVYFEYKMTNASPEQTGQQDLSYADEYDYKRLGCQAYRVTVEITLYNAQDGMYILEGCGVAAHHSEPLRRLFKDAGVAFIEVQNITNQSTYDDEEINYEHQMVCAFREYAELELTEFNAVVETIRLQIDENLEIKVIPPA
jgi:hypothetical protein